MEDEGPFPELTATMAHLADMELEPRRSLWMYTVDDRTPECLISTRCIHCDDKGKRCDARVDFTAPFCLTHLMTDRHMAPGRTTVLDKETGARLKSSGLFAHCPGETLVKGRKKSALSSGKNGVSLGLPYLGLQHDDDNFLATNGNQGGPYVARHNGKTFDCSRLRSAASLINAAPKGSMSCTGKTPVANCRLSWSTKTKSFNIKSIGKTIKHGDEMFMEYTLSQLAYTTTHSETGNSHDTRSWCT